jgi:ketosteroid isomerase-like protein
MQNAAIEDVVGRTATELLRAKDAATVLSYFEPDATIARNGYLYPSFDAFAKDIRDSYPTIRQFNLAAWDDVRVDVFGADAAVFTATFRWASTDTAGVREDIQGVWSAVFVRHEDGWKIRQRHESFVR